MIYVILQQQKELQLSVRNLKKFSYNLVKLPRIWTKLATWEDLQEEQVGRMETDNKTPFSQELH